ncbi:unnamed protein product [Hymenolepis diminuta]|uniref:Uncharacterized protein n=1 Tax=Hymenolepis diminuta TaxID=6216 RepID=A0A564YW53_HYMDI|nr:unnamed protein product [Hymenolepis diminuta]
MILILPISMTSRWLAKLKKNIRSIQRLFLNMGLSKISPKMKLCEITYLFSVIPYLPKISKPLTKK